MRGFRPRLWPTLLTVPALLVLLGLGTWQVQRLHWKEALIAERQAGLAAPATDWTEATEGPGELLWHRVSAEGRFLHDSELLLAARSMNGNPGYHIVTPFELGNGSVLLIDRGWVPLERKEPQARAEGQVEGTRTISGILRPGHRPSWLTPDNQPERNFWFWMDLPAMAGSADLEQRAVTEAYLEADAAPNPGGFPIGGQTRTDLPNDHLQYAITWYALALALSVIYILYHRAPDGRAERSEAKS
ncbi:MAG TPA: SURF1 family protein [Alphaproteobacteria bacterium]|nr:SURF1 family protein [Alphaproteobacteria bacterium]